MLHTPAFSGIPKQRGTKSEFATSPLPSGGPTSGRKCYVTPAFSGIPNKGDKIKAQKKNKKNLNKNFSMVSLFQPCRLPSLGFEPMSFQLQRHCFTQ